jgi:hypothetical protein
MPATARSKWCIWIDSTRGFFLRVLWCVTSTKLLGNYNPVLVQPTPHVAWGNLSFQ